MSEPSTVDFWSLICHAKGAPPEWRWGQLAVLGDYKSPRAETYNSVKGAVYGPPTLYKSGPRKGQLKKHNPIPGTEREFIIGFAEFDAFVAKWRADHAEPTP